MASKKNLHIAPTAASVQSNHRRLQQRKTTGGVFLDVEKAFDRMWHRGLIFKMIHLKFPDYIINLTHSFLTNRTFQVRIEATTSRIAHIEAGSPQGSNLSPILYNIYTYDFPTSPLVEVCLFADDAAIISQASNPVNVRTRLQLTSTG
ncbi:RNA-directed DNA polymerase from mobile element jockey [Trichonephila clavipes]|nr:RNA-directed DNA polymerase from mobile element jockey [Trichonephila clavipes]